MPSGYILGKVHDAHRKRIMLCHDLFTIPHEYIRNRIKNPPDRLIITVHTLIWITEFYLLNALIEIARTIAIVSRKTWNTWRTAITNYAQTATAFASSTGIENYLKRVRKRRKSHRL